MRRYAVDRPRDVAHADEDDPLRRAPNSSPTSRVNYSSCSSALAPLPPCPAWERRVDERYVFLLSLLTLWRQPE